MTRRLKVAVVGAGFSNSLDGRERWAIRAHLPALRALPDRYEVVALCTTRTETAAAAARHFEVPHAFGDVQQMLHDVDDIDVVCVSVRPAVQHGVVMTALRAGKHVYCEQPLGLTTAQAEEMRQLAEDKHVRTVVGHQTHYEPAVLHMAELVRQGYIGRPLTFAQTEFFSNYILPRPAHRQWLFQAEMGGHPGYRSGQGLERLTAVLRQDVTEISATMDTKVVERANLDGGPPIRSNQVDNMSYLLRVGDAIEGTLQVSFTAWFGTGTRFEIYGTEGMLMLAPGSSPGRGSGELRLYGARANLDQVMKDRKTPERLERDFEEVPGSEAYRHVALQQGGRDVFLVAQTWRALSEAIESGRECSPSFHDKVRIHRVWDAAERSTRERRWITVDYSGLGMRRQA